MRDYTINDLREISCVNKIITVVHNDSSEIKGVLSKITSDSICVCEINSNIEINIPDKSIKRLYFNNQDSAKLFRKLNEMKIRYDKISDDAYINIPDMFQQELQEFASVCGNVVLSSYIEEEIGNKSAKYSIHKLELIYDDFLVNTKNKYVGNPIIAVIESLILIRMRRSDEAYSCALNQLTKYPEILFLICTCLSVQTKNIIESVYWLNMFFSYKETRNIPKLKTWWYYIRMISRYSAYDQAIPVMKKFAQTEPKLMIESLIYLLVSDNHAGIAVNLLDYIDCSLTAEILESLIDHNIIFLITDEDNNYHRLLRCINTIINNKDIKLYSDSEYINGYVYDYVPDRKFGFIIGFDLVVYFFRAESIINEYLDNKIRKNICSMEHVKNEELVLVSFKRSRESKRSFNAIEIM